MPHHFTAEKPFIVAQTDPRGHLQYFDDTFAAMLKMEPGRLCGMNVLDITETGFKAASKLMFDNAVRTGAGYTIAQAFCDSEGASIPSLLHVAILRTDEGGVAGAVGIIQPRSRF